MKCLFVLDDITISVHKQRDRESPGGISPIPESMTMGQALELGVIVIVHTLSGLSEIIQQNVEVIFVFGLPGQDPRLVCNMLRVNPEQAEKLRVLRPGEFVALNPLIWPKTVYATFLPPNIPGICTEEMRRSAVEEFLRNVKTSAPAPLSAFRSNLPDETQDEVAATDSQMRKLPPRCIELMVHVAASLPAPVTKIYARMALSSTAGRRIIKRLQELGLARIHCFPTGKRGGQISLIELTEPAWELLREKGFAKPKPKTGGDWEHEVAAQLIEAEGKKLGYKVSFEVELGGVRVDVQWLDTKTGQRKLFNIGISRPAYEVESIEKLLKLPASNDSNLTLVARDSTFAKKVNSIIKATDPKGDVFKHIEIKLLTDFLK